MTPEDKEQVFARIREAVEQRYDVEANVERSAAAWTASSSSTA